MEGTLLEQVQRSLCCPEGECRALAAGMVKDCGAKMTKEHAEKAIAIVQDAYRPKVKALLEIRRKAIDAADVEITSFTNEQEKFRELAKLASDALA